MPCHEKAVNLRVKNENKMNLRHIITVFCAILPAFSLMAVTDSLDEALLLLRSGDTLEAIDMLQRLQKKNPRATDIDITLGDAYRALGDSKSAIASYRSAQKKGDNNAWLSLADLAAEQYRISDAEEDIELYRKGLKKGRKTLPDESEATVEKVDRMRYLLERVQKIEIIDSINVDAEDFFSHYRLSPESGTLMSSDLLGDDLQPAYGSVVFTPETRMQRVFTSVDENQSYRLVSQSKIYGGEWDAPQPLGDQLGQGGDANFPFMMPDGITLYYANNGENSMGGYDIFVTRKSGQEFLEPQSLGLPFNSPFNDYMLAIDEFTGAGWWATDRNRIPGMVTIYIFIPQEMRENYDPEDPKLASYARIDRIADTQADGKDYSALRERIASNTATTSEQPNEEKFMISVPGRGVLTSIEDFRSQGAQIEVMQYLKMADLFKRTESELDCLRRQYGQGKRQTGDEILTLEKRQRADREKLRQQLNKVIKLELQ